MKNDNVKHPHHYTNGSIECIEAIRESMCTIAFEGYLKGNVMKYLWRYKDKNGLEDLEKARVYLNWLIEELENEEEVDMEVECITRRVKDDIERAFNGRDGI